MAFSWDNPGMKSAPKSELCRELPSVDELLHTSAVASLAASHGPAAVTDAARAVLARVREEVASGLLVEPALRLALGGLGDAIEKHLRQSLGHSLRPVINATGVILHTNLGRSPLAESALAHIGETAGRFSNLDFDIGNAGVAAEANTIRIGIQGTQTAAFIAGINGTLVTGDAVMVSSTGQLGIVKSSARFKA